MIKKRGRNTRWLRYGKRQIKGVAKATADLGSSKHPPICIFNYLKKI
jgi:hypothetical protein